MTREELNTYIDENVTDKTAPDSLSPTDEGNALKAVADYVDQQVDTIPVGPAGPEGVQGPAGPVGPVGPTGLNWQGQWSDSAEYVEDDAVGFNGASYFCINAVGPSADDPETDTTNWALLASQGAQGVQGVQGPAGPQGPQGNPAPFVTDIQYTPISAAQMLNIFSSPVKVLNQEEGKVRIPIAIYYRKSAGSLYVFPGGNVFKFEGTNTGTFSNFNLSTNPLTTSTDSGEAYFSISSQVNVVNPVDLSQEEYFLSVYGSNPTSGTADLDVYVVYHQITL